MDKNYRKSYRVPRELAEKIIRECLELSDFTSVDELDCSKSFARQVTDKTVSEVLKIGFNNKATLYNFIYRPDLYGYYEAYFDIGFCTIGIKPEYFLWLNLTPENAQNIIDKYKLQSYE